MIEERMFVGVKFIPFLEMQNIFWEAQKGNRKVYSGTDGVEHIRIQSFKPNYCIFNPR